MKARTPGTAAWSATHAPPRRAATWATRSALGWAQALHEQFASNGLISLNEIGVDPGLDHMSAVKIIDEVRACAPACARTRVQAASPTISSYESR